MIPLGPITSTAGTTFSANQIIGLMVQPSLRMRWIFDLMSSQLVYKADLTALVNFNSPPKIDHDSTRAVKRQLTLQMRPSTSANVLQDLIRVRYQIETPDGGEVEWIIGTFMFTPPKKTITEGYTWWDVTAPDLSQLLSDAAFTSATAITAGTGYIQAVTSLAQSYGGQTPFVLSIPDSGATLPASLGWNAGDSYLKAINDLLAAIAYVPVWANGNLLVSRQEPDYTQASPVMTLDTVSGLAWIVGPLTEQPDYSNAYNQILVVGQDPRRVAVSYLYQNTRADSPISLVNWHPRLKAINDSSLSSVTACQVRAFAEAQKAARVYSVLTVGTVPFPFFEDLDVITLAYQSADEGLVRYPYIVMKGTHICHPGTQTTGILQRIIAA